MAFTYPDLISPAGGLTHHLQAKAWVVGVSGGLDSMCLLHALVQLSQHQLCPPLRLIHINHGLNSQADVWQRLVETQSQSYGLQCMSQSIVIDPLLQQKEGLEAAARHGRYQVFEQHLQAGEVLLLAQHGDDQTETMLLRLFRGAGVSGLRAMPQQRVLGLGHLTRPLLHVRQPDLVAYAAQHQLQWCEDPSNQDSKYDRNYLRHQVIPLLRQRWQSLDRRLATTAAVMDDTQELLNEVAKDDLASLCDSAQRLTCAGLLGLSKARRHNLLRFWLHEQQVAMPSYNLMQRIDKEILASADDGQPCIELASGSEALTLRKSKGVLVLVRASESVISDQSPWHVEITSEHIAQEVISLPVGELRLGLHSVPGLKLTLGDVLERRFRQGGERCRPVGRRHSQMLKKLLQAAEVPPWQRQNLPLLYVNDHLAAVADLWINSGFESAQNIESWCWFESSKSAPFDCSN